MIISALSRADIEAKIDAFLAEEKRFKVLKLITPANGSAVRFEYQGMHVREWHAAGNVRYDVAVKLESEK